MSDPKLEIVWRRKSETRQVYFDYESDDGRWFILHPKNSESNRWELYDRAASAWHGDWRSLAAAKDKARVLVRTGSNS